MKHTKKPLSIRSLAKEMRIDPRTLETRLRDVEPAGKTSHGPTYTLEQAVSAYKASKPANAPIAGKEELLAEQIRKLKIANDAKQGTLIPRAVVFAQRAKLASLFVAAGHRVVNEGSMTIAARLGLPDIAQCRAVVRDAVTMMGELVHGFADELTEE